MEESATNARLLRCIRDLAALNALPSMCIGRSRSEALEIILEALPTVLACELVLVRLPEGGDHVAPKGSPIGAAAVATLAATLGRAAAGTADVAVATSEKLHWACVEVPLGRLAGSLVIGKKRPLEDDTDRVLLRTAANLVGTTLQTAHVLESARRKDEFLAMLGHELRNPLAPILTAVELIARRKEAPREQEVIERNTRHLARLVDDLLDISRVTSGHIELRRELLALTDVLDRAVELAAPLIARNRHALSRTSRSEVTVAGDPVRLAQIFGNLLTNAAKFTPEGGTIELCTEITGERVRVTVRDDGRGIDAEQLSQIFEPFVQVDRVTDGARGGLGLGLAIVKDLVERHGGTVHAASEGRGRGAAFHVELPVVHAASVSLSAPTPRSTTRRGTRVLVVDDNIDGAELLSDALQMHGYETIVAHDGRAALASWESFAPHAAILDVGLPDVDGYEVARAIRASHGAAPTLMAVTGYGQPGDRQRAAEAGFDCHFVKPVSVADLVRILDARTLVATT